MDWNGHMHLNWHLHRHGHNPFDHPIDKNGPVYHHHSLLGDHLDGLPVCGYNGWWVVGNGVDLRWALRAGL